MGHKGGFSRRCPTSYVWARYSFGTFSWSLWIIPTKIARCEGLSKNGLFVPSPSCGILSQSFEPNGEICRFLQQNERFSTFLRISKHVFFESDDVPRFYQILETLARV